MFVLNFRLTCLLQSNFQSFNINIIHPSVFLNLLNLGVEYKFIPETNGVPIVTDMSSSIMTKELDITKVKHNTFICILTYICTLSVWCDIWWSSEEYRPSWSHCSNYQRRFTWKSYEDLSFRVRFYTCRRYEFDTQHTGNFFVNSIKILNNEKIHVLFFQSIRYEFGV